MKRLFGVTGVAVGLVALGFVAGMYVGSRPLQRQISRSGGPLGTIAMDLQASASVFGAGQHTYGAKDVVAEQVRLADIRSLVAAQSYCGMTPMYREVARKSAQRLSASPYMETSPVSNSGREARTYLSTATSNATTCAPFRDAATADAGEGRGENMAAAQRRTARYASDQ